MHVQVRLLCNDVLSDLFHDVCVYSNDICVEYAPELKRSSYMRDVSNALCLHRCGVAAAAQGDTLSISGGTYSEAGVTVCHSKEGVLFVGSCYFGCMHIHTVIYVDVQSLLTNSIIDQKGVDFNRRWIGCAHLLLQRKKGMLWACTH